MSASLFTPRSRSGERAMSSALYAGGRSNGSPSPDLDGATLVLALLALNTAADPCGEMFVVRMLRERPTPARALAGADKGKGSRAVLAE